jgi:hypothetical protein
MANPVAAVTSVVTTPAAAFKAHPVVWGVALTIVAAVVIRYRSTIIGWFSKAPGPVSSRVVPFLRA